MKIYFDTEFTGLHQGTTLISIGLVSEDGRTFYAEFTDYDRSQVDEWIEKNVIANLKFAASGSVFVILGVDSNWSGEVCGEQAWIVRNLQLWLEQFDRCEMVSDCHAYDWVLFCELFGGALDIPKNVYYIPFDLSTALLLAGVDPDVNREEYAKYAKIDGDKHNALHDAQVIRACWEGATA